MSSTPDFRSRMADLSTTELGLVRADLEASLERDPESMMKADRLRIVDDILTERTAL